MSFYQSKGLWTTSIICLFLLLIAGSYGLKLMTSIYKKDMGNGVVIYADDYVKSGRWVFDCDRRRLISRLPLPVPIKEIKQAATASMGKMYALSEADVIAAKKAIRAIATIPDWYNNLRYHYSVLGESSDLNTHVYDLVATHENRQWVLSVWQEIDYSGESSFDITAEPYDPGTYIDHAKMLQAAAQSCPVAQ